MTALLPWTRPLFSGEAGGCTRVSERRWFQTFQTVSGKCGGRPGRGGYARSWGSRPRQERWDWNAELWSRGPPQEFLDLPHDLRDAEFLLEDVLGQLLRRQVFEVLPGVRVLDVEVAVFREDRV